MPSIEVDIRRPVFVFPPPTGGEAVLAGEVVIRGAQKIQAGGVKVEWGIHLERRGRLWSEWGPTQSMGRYEVMACGARELNGNLRLPFSLKLPTDIPPTRETEFDRITHTITASIVEPVPDYSTSHSHPSSPVTSPYSSPLPSRSGSMIDLSSSAPPKKGLLRSMLRRHTADQVRLRDAVKHLATELRSRSEVQVISDKQELRRLDWHHINEVDSLGRFDVCYSSDLFILGSTIDMEMIVTNLSSDATLHSAALSLVQHTYAPPPTPSEASPLLTSDLARTPSYTLAPVAHPVTHLPPFSLPAEETTWSAFDLPPFPDVPGETVMDSYRIYEVGIPHHPYSDRLPMEGEYIWRGGTVRAQDKLAKKDKLFGNKSQKPIADVLATATTVRIHKRLPLPSPVIGALPSYHHNGGIARVGHKLHVALFYSVLGQDEKGQELPRRNGLKQEGVMRVYYAEKDVVLGPCCGLPDNLIAPPYTPSAPVTPARPVLTRRNTAEKVEEESKGVVRSRAYGMKGKERMHDVPTAQKVLKERLRQHERETGGACVCFTTVQEEGLPGKIV